MENQFKVGEPVRVMGWKGVYYVVSVPHGEVVIGPLVFPAKPCYIVMAAIEILPENLVSLEDKEGGLNETDS